jgi:hypothetical protein
VRATVFVYSLANNADFYYTSSVDEVDWKYIGSVKPLSDGLQDLSVSYTLPIGGSNIQAVRVNFRSNDVDDGPCTNGDYNDHDDLAFTVVRLPTSAPTTMPSFSLLPTSTSPTFAPSLTNIPSLSSKPSTEGKTVKTLSPTDISNSVSADRVRIEAHPGEYLHMLEFRIQSTFSSNVALHGSASQSSDYSSNFAASNAIDNLNSTFSHTATADSNAWWEVQLGSSVDVKGVVILNRFCQEVSDLQNCLCRLSNARITLYENNVSMATRQLGNTCGELILSEYF